MRKVYVLSLLLLTAASGAFAQRSIDWSVEEIITPTQLNSNASTGTSLSTEFVLKNNGTDAVKVGDTILYQVSVSNLNNQIVVAYPAPTSFAFILATKEINSGDTIHIARPLNTTAYVTTSVDVRFNVISYVRNGGSADPITAEVAPGNANNIKQVNMTWWNPQGWNVSIEESVSNGSFTISPNPATTEISVSWNVSNVNSINKITVYDMTGRVVASSEAESGTFEKSLNVESLKAGMYIVEVSNGTIKSTQKLQVAR